MEVNEEKRKKFMEYAGKRVNNVMHDIQILEPMSRSSAYDFTKEDVEEMFSAMQDALNTVKASYDKKFEEKSRTERKVFSFGAETAPVVETNENEEVIENVLKDFKASLMPVELDCKIECLPSRLEEVAVVAPNELFEGFFVAKIRKE